MLKPGKSATSLTVKASTFVWRQGGLGFSLHRLDGALSATRKCACSLRVHMRIVGELSAVSRLSQDIATFDGLIVADAGDSLAEV